MFSWILPIIGAFVSGFYGVGVGLVVGLGIDFVLACMEEDA